MANGTKLLEIPEKVFDSILQVYQKVEEFHNEFEDFAFSANDQFIRKMRKAREEHLSGKTRELAELKREL